jgi:hypothetical protein
VLRAVDGIEAKGMATEAVMDLFDTHWKEQDEMTLSFAQATIEEEEEEEGEEDSEGDSDDHVLSPLAKENVRSVSPIDPTASNFVPPTQAPAPITFTIDPHAHAAMVKEQKRLAEEHKQISTAAAVALQRELMEHGTKDMAKINTLRRASMAPDDAEAMAAMTSAMMDTGDSRRLAGIAAASSDDDDAEEDEETKTVRETLLREAARLIVWRVGQVIYIDTEDGYALAVRLSLSARSVFPSFSAIFNGKMQKLPPFSFSLLRNEGKNRC